MPSQRFPRSARRAGVAALRLLLSAFFWTYAAGQIGVGRELLRRPLFHHRVYCRRL
jgi:hypothetical protein